MHIHISLVNSKNTEKIGTQSSSEEGETIW